MRVPPKAAPAPNAAAPTAAPQGPARTPPLSELAQVGHQLADVFGKVEHFAQQYLHPLGTWNNPAAPAALPDRGGLRMASYNIKDGGADLAGVERDLSAQSPEVVCLQECSKESALALGKKLGYHVAFYDSPVHSYGGNAILSRYPITQTEAIRYDNPMVDRVKAFWNELTQHRPGVSMFDQRMMLHCTLQVGGRQVDVIDTHLTLLDAPGNTQNLIQLNAKMRELEAQGRTVIAAGDMNSNFSLARDGVADPSGTRSTATDTAAELKDRYGKSASNIGDAADRKAVQQLLQGHSYYWDAAERHVVVNGQVLTPEQAQAELDSGRIPKGSELEKRLQLAVDGATLGGGDRLDNLIASKDVRFTSATIDQTTRASDHRPVFADVRWD